MAWGTSITDDTKRLGCARVSDEPRFRRSTDGAGAEKITPVAHGRCSIRWMTHSRGELAFARMLIAILVVAIVCCLGVLSRAAGGMATRRLAMILLDFTHVATTSQREELHAILHDDTFTVHERVVAAALLHMEHIVSVEDRRRLERVIGDASAPEDVRVLASIITQMTHTLTQPERERVWRLLRKDGA